MALKSRKRSKNILVLKLLINLILIILVSSGIYFLLQGRLPIVVERQKVQKTETDFIEQIKNLKYLNLEAQEFCSPDVYGSQIEIVTNQGWRIILDSNGDLKEQLNLLEAAINKGLKVNQYIGIDAQGIIYYK